MIRPILLALPASALLAACIPSEAPTQLPSPPQQQGNATQLPAAPDVTATQLPSAVSTRTGSAADENACLNAVGAQTNNTVSVLSSDFSEANTLVMVGVGPMNAPWRCLVSNGVVAEVMSMVDEGAL